MADITYKIDSGAGGNLMPLKTFTLYPKLTMEVLCTMKNNVINSIKTYNISNIEQLGVC